jgi:hypothetical protein
MTIETTPAPTANPGLLKRGKGLLKALAIGLLALAIAAWISLGVGLYVGVDKGIRIALAVAAAVTTEGLFWTTAALLGVSVVEARKRIWRTLTGRKAA